jgi:hypothetical protein
MYFYQLQIIIEIRCKVSETEGREREGEGERDRGQRERDRGQREKRRLSAGLTLSGITGTISGRIRRADSSCNARNITVYLTKIHDLRTDTAYKVFSIRLDL